MYLGWLCGPDTSLKHSKLKWCRLPGSLGARVLCKGGVPAWCGLDGAARALSSLDTRCQKRLTLVLAEAWWQYRGPRSCHQPQGWHSLGRGESPLWGPVPSALCRTCASLLSEKTLIEAVTLGKQKASSGF